MPGVVTLCPFVPSERVAVVVLCNTHSSVVSYLSEMIFKIMLPEKKQEPKGDSKPSDGPQASDEPPPRSELLGKWKGQLVTYKSETPLEVSIKELSDVRVKLGKQLETLLSGATYQGGFLRGRFAGSIDYDDARGRPYQVQLELKLRGDVLDGSVIVTTEPDAWGSSAVTQWVELKRVSSPAGEKIPPATASGD